MPSDFIAITFYGLYMKCLFIFCFKQLDFNQIYNIFIWFVVAVFLSFNQLFTLMKFFCASS